MKLLLRHISDSQKQDKKNGSNGQNKAIQHGIINPISTYNTNICTESLPKQQVNFRKGGTTPFKAVARVRPLFLPESLKNPIPCVEAIDRESIIFKQDFQSNALKQLTAEKLFRCTKAMPAGSKTDQIFSLQIVDFAKDALKGKSSATFIIGGKESGKTHTLIGSVADPGLCFSFARTLFQLKEKQYSDSRIYLSIFSFRNNFKDLLTYTNLSLEHKSTSQGAYIPGLSKIECHDILSYLTFLKTALIVDGKRDVNRDFSQAYTLFNPHIEKAIFIIKFTIVNTETVKNESNQMITKETTSETYFVDCETYNPTEKIEAKGVNNAMLSLNNCLRSIFQINKGIQETSFVPFEQSPFTSFFKEFLGGKSQTYIIGTLSPFAGHVEQSMRTMREIEWAVSSKSQGPDTEPYVLSKETGFIKTLHYQSVLISYQIRLLSCKSTDLNEHADEKLKYTKILAEIFERFRFGTTLLAKKIEQIYEIQLAVESIQSDILIEQCSVLKDHVRSTDTKEFFIVKVVPLMFNLVYTKITKLQAALEKKLKQLKGEVAIVKDIRKWFREEQESNLKSINQLKPSYIDTITNFLKAAQEYNKWTFSQFYRSLNIPLTPKQKRDSLKVSKYFNASFTRIFKALNIEGSTDFNDPQLRLRFGIRRSANRESKLMPRTTSQESETSNFFSHKIEKQNSDSIDNDDNESDEDNEDNEYSENGSCSDECEEINNDNKSELSSIFNLPSSSTLIKENPKFGGIDFTFALNPIQRPTLTEQPDIEQSSLKQKSPEVMVIPFGKDIAILEEGRYYDEDDPNNLYKSKQTSHNPSKIAQNKHNKSQSNQQSTIKTSESTTYGTPELKPNIPQITIQANREEVKLSRKLQDRIPSIISPIHQTHSLPRLNKSPEQSKQHTLPTLRQTDEVDCNEFKSKSVVQHLHQAQQNLQQQQQQHDISLMASSPKSQLSNSISDKQQESMLPELTVVRSPSSSIRQYPIDSIYFKDITLSSQFNQRVVVNVNLFRNDLEYLRLPESIHKIFQDSSKKSLISHNNSRGNSSDIILPQLQNSNPNTTKAAAIATTSTTQTSLKKTGVVNSQLSLAPPDIKNASRKYIGILERSILQQKLRKGMNKHSINVAESKAKSLLESSIDCLKQLQNKESEQKKKIFRMKSRNNNNNSSEFDEEKSIIHSNSVDFSNKHRKPEFFAITKQNKHLASSTQTYLANSHQNSQFDSVNESFDSAANPIIGQINEVDDTDEDQIEHS